MDDEEFQAMMRYQSFVSRQVVQEAKTDRKINVLMIVNDLSPTSKKKIQTNAILVEAEHRGMTENEVYEIVDELVREGMLIDAGEGYVKRT
jgi:DNA replicative helicase MCM subunit Mcm2 (Cdc46/Mcm family)